MRFDKVWHHRGDASRAFYKPKSFREKIALWFRGWRCPGGTLWNKPSKRCRKLCGR